MRTATFTADRVDGRKSFQIPIMSADEFAEQLYRGKGFGPAEFQDYIRHNGPVLILPNVPSWNRNASVEPNQSTIVDQDGEVVQVRAHDDPPVGPHDYDPGCGCPECWAKWDAGYSIFDQARKTTEPNIAAAFAVPPVVDPSSICEVCGTELPATHRWRCDDCIPKPGRPNPIREVSTLADMARAAYQRIKDANRPVEPVSADVDALRPDSV